MKKPEEMTVEEIKSEIDILNTRLGVTKMRLDRLLQHNANVACPYKVGDVLVDSRGQRARIDEINKNQRGYGPPYSMWGKYIKRDETEGVRDCRFHHWDKWGREPDSDA